MFRSFLSEALDSKKRSTALTPTQAWAIAAGASLAALRGDRLDSLAAGKPQARAQTMLREWWGIENAKSLYETIDWLKREGHSIRFRRLATLAGDLSEQEYQFHLTNLESKARAQLELARTQRARAPEALIGWDMARLINVLRAAYDAGYIDEAHAWREIMGAARTIQHTFHSWQELYDNYLLGRQFWGGGKDTDKYLVQKSQWLLRDPASPWKKLPWNLRLA